MTKGRPSGGNSPATTNEQIERALIELIRRNDEQDFQLEIQFVDGRWKVALFDERSLYVDEDATDDHYVGEGNTFYEAWNHRKPLPSGLIDADYLRDIELASAYLAGGHWSVGKPPRRVRGVPRRMKELPQKTYLKGKEEGQALAALLALLRRQHPPLDRSIAQKLAALLDPNSEDAFSFDAAPIERKLVLKPRKNGTAQNLRKLEMAMLFETRLQKVEQWLVQRIEKSQSATRKINRRRKTWILPTNLRERMQRKIAEQCGVDERTVQSAVAFLRQHR